MIYAELNRDDREDLYAFLCRRLAWGDLSALVQVWLRQRLPEIVPPEEQHGKRWGRGWRR